jgi:curved DNA-binding protein
MDQPQYSRGGGSCGPFAAGHQSRQGSPRIRRPFGARFSDFFEQFSRRDSPPEERPRLPRANPAAPRDVEADIRSTLRGGKARIARSPTCARSRHGAPAVQTYNIKIPAGIREGQKIRLAGQGNGGDLFLNVRFLQHPEFRREGDDLFYDLELAPWEAVLGATIPLQTLDGKVNLRIKPGTQGGQQLRLNGLGLHNEHGQRGDLHVIIRVQVPEDPPAAERALWEKLSETSQFNPRE